MASPFTPRLSLPEYGNPYYNTKKYSGGYSPCVLGNPRNRVKGLDVLANCVGWVTGRFNELGNYGYCKWLGSYVAYYMATAARRQGLTIQKEPALGGCLVWSGGNTSEGHVAIVEKKIYVAGKLKYIVTSESEYYGKSFVNFIREIGDGNWRVGCKWMENSKKPYYYTGCIVHPDIKEKEDDDEVVTDLKMMNKDTGKVVTVKGIFKDGRNYPALSDLGDLNVMEVSYDAQAGLPVIGKEDVVEDRQIKNLDTGEVVTVKGVFVNQQNYVRLADLAAMGVVEVSYDAENNLPEVGKAE
jgi:hypothetical protein